MLWGDYQKYVDLLKKERSDLRKVYTSNTDNSIKLIFLKMHRHNIRVYSDKLDLELHNMTLQEVSETTVNFRILFINVRHELNRLNKEIIWLQSNN